jgi:hypothetical protein
VPLTAATLVVPLNVPVFGRTLLDDDGTLFSIDGALLDDDGTLLLIHGVLLDDDGALVTSFVVIASDQLSCQAQRRQSYQTHYARQFQFHFASPLKLPGIIPALEFVFPTVLVVLPVASLLFRVAITLAWLTLIRLAVLSFTGQEVIDFIAAIGHASGHCRHQGCYQQGQQDRLT